MKKICRKCHLPRTHVAPFAIGKRAWKEICMGCAADLLRKEEDRKSGKRISQYLDTVFAEHKKRKEPKIFPGSQIGNTTTVQDCEYCDNHCDATFREITTKTGKQICVWMAYPTGWLIMSVSHRSDSILLLVCSADCALAMANVIFHDDMEAPVPPVPLPGPGARKGDNELATALVKTAGGGRRG